MSTLADVIQQKIRRVVANGCVVLGVSGGIDSLVLALILSEFNRDNLRCLFVDSGLDRLGDKEELISFCNRKRMKLKIINVKKRILSGLKAKTKSSDKKTVIKAIFRKVFDNYAKQVSALYIAHGTNKDDTELLFDGKKQTLRYLETGDLRPFIYITKNEILDIAHYINLPKAFLNKYPLSTWGMSRRIIGEVTPEKLRIVRAVDAIFIDFLKKYKIYTKLKNAAVYLYPFASGKINEFFVITKAVTTNSQPATLPLKLHKEMVRKITREYPQISRVTYDLSEEGYINREWD